MREQQFIRFVQQICFLLKLSQPCSKTALQYFMQFKEYEGHHFDQQILIGACIYLSVKIFEQEVRIRDILNMIYVLTSLYKISQKQANEEIEGKEMNDQIQIQKKQQIKFSQEHDQQIKGDNNGIQIENNQMQIQNIQLNKRSIEQKLPVNNEEKDQELSQSHQQPYVLLKNIQRLQNLTQIIQPRYSLSEYNEYKGRIIEAEQTLLRILGFNFSLSEQNKNQLKRLLITIHHMRIPSTTAETIVKVYNDIHYIDIGYWPQGVIYFSFLLIKIYVKQKQQPQSSLELKEAKSESSHHKASERQTAQMNKIKEFIQRMSSNKKWEELLCTTIKDLQQYAEKLTNFYSGIKIS